MQRVVAFWKTFCIVKTDWAGHGYNIAIKRATVNPLTWVSCYSWSSNGLTITTVWHGSQEHTTLPSTTSDRQRARAKRKNVCKSNGLTRWCNLESPYFVSSISVRSTDTWAFFFERRFQPLSVGGFSQTNGNPLFSALEPISVKNSKSTNNPSFSFKDYSKALGQKSKKSQAIFCRSAFIIYSFILWKPFFAVELR